MRKFHITDNLDDLGDRVCKEEIRLLLGVTSLLLPELTEQGKEEQLSVKEVKAIESGPVHKGVNTTPSRT